MSNIRNAQPDPTKYWKALITIRIPSFVFYRFAAQAAKTASLRLSWAVTQVVLPCSRSFDLLHTACSCIHIDGLPLMAQIAATAGCVFSSFYDFANKEELHYLVAANHLRALRLGLTNRPFDVELWHTYFSKIAVERPFARMGAAAMLENLSNRENRDQFKFLLSALFLNQRSTKFLALHIHESLPHGDQILDAPNAEDLSDSHCNDRKHPANPS